MSAKQDDSKVNVAIRIRPFNAMEECKNSTNCLIIENSSSLTAGSRNFRFEKIFSEQISQESIYSHIGRDLVKSFFEGYNASILAYGQTGSGKTYTMGTSNTQIDNEIMGLIPRIASQIIKTKLDLKGEKDIGLKLTFVEIYNEEIQDLLSPLSKKESLCLREENGSISLLGAQEDIIEVYQDFLYALQKGNLQRKTATTYMNESSSRSHAILTMILEQNSINEEGENLFSLSKFHFVDLAGSERAKKSGATGATLKEGININRGLLALSNVISALTDNSPHIPYRESKLTRILQDSLGGNSKTWMIACISPSSYNLDETLNTLKYAARAKNIKNKPVINCDPQQALIAQLRKQIYDLHNELSILRKSMVLSNDGDYFVQNKENDKNGIEIESEINSNFYSSSNIIRDEEIVNRSFGDQESEEDLQICEIKLIEKEKLLQQLTIQQKFHDEAKISSLINEYKVKIEELESKIQKCNNFPNPKYEVELRNLQKKLQMHEKNKEMIQKQKEKITKLSTEIKTLKKERDSIQKKLMTRVTKAETSLFKRDQDLKRANNKNKQFIHQIDLLKFHKEEKERNLNSKIKALERNLRVLKKHDPSNKGISQENIDIKTLIHYIQTEQALKNEEIEMERISKEIEELKESCLQEEHQRYLESLYDSNNFRNKKIEELNEFIRQNSLEEIIHKIESNHSCSNSIIETLIHSLREGLDLKDKLINQESLEIENLKKIEYLEKRINYINHQNELKTTRLMQEYEGRIHELLLQNQLLTEENESKKYDNQRKNSSDSKEECLKLKKELKVATTKNIQYDHLLEKMQKHNEIQHEKYVNIKRMNENREIGLKDLKAARNTLKSNRPSWSINLKNLENKLPDRSVSPYIPPKSKGSLQMRRRTNSEKIYNSQKKENSNQYYDLDTPELKLNLNEVLNEQIKNMPNRVEGYGNESLVWKL